MELIVAEVGRAVEIKFFSEYIFCCFEQEGF